MPFQKKTQAEETNSGGTLTLEPSPLAETPTPSPSPVPEVVAPVASPVPQPVEEKPKPRDFGIEIDPDKVYVFEAIDKTPAQRHEIIGSVDKIYDTVENRIREIRCISVAQSIFVDEQDKQDPELKKRQPEILDLYNNHLTVNGSDTRKMEYLLSHNGYEGNPRRLSSMPPVYRLQNKEQYDTEKAKQNKYELDALKSVSETDIQDLTPVARVIFGITDTSETAIRNAMADKVKQPKSKKEVKSNAELYLDQLNDPTIARKYIIQRAIDKGVLTIDVNNKAVKWTSTRSFITNVSATTPKTVLNDLVTFSMSSQGKDFYAQLRAKEAKAE